MVTVVSEMTLEDAQELQTGFRQAVSLLHTWSWTPSDVLDEELRIMLRSFKAAARDMYLLIRAALVAKQNRHHDLSEPPVLEA